MTIIQSGRLTATEQGERNRNAVMLTSDGTSLGVSQGVQSGLNLVKTSGMGWQLDLGRCMISSATAANGAVAAAVVTSEIGSFAAGDATRDRIDIVGLQIDETATIANGYPAVKTTVIQGAYPVSGQPVMPTIPAGTLGLWAARINAGTSAGSGGWNTALLTDIRTPLSGSSQLVTLRNLYTNATNFRPITVRRIGARAVLNGAATNVGTTTWTAGASYPLGDLPAGFAPALGLAERFPITWATVSGSNPVAGWAGIDSTGTITFALSQTISGAAANLYVMSVSHSWDD